jgi:hypothetical protein
MLSLSAGPGVRSTGLPDAPTFWTVSLIEPLQQQTAPQTAASRLNPAFAGVKSSTARPLHNRLEPAEQPVDRMLRDVKARRKVLTGDINTLLSRLG